MLLKFRRLIFAVVVLACAAGFAAAREASFLDPGTSAGGANEEALKVEPKADIDVGETVLNMTKRTSVFFSNVSGSPVRVEKVTVNSDANVAAETTANDCIKQGSIEASSRCSVEVSVTPSSAGAWSVDLLMTHNGAGRITRARLSGKTSGSTANDGKGAGLALNSKETKPVDFGDFTVGSGKVVRSALMVNDSAEAITLYSIDVIEADNGLQRLDQGCAIDMELPPGASCPVTLLWVPKNNGPISTDLIIRHSGKMGFAVVPIRGMAKNGTGGTGGSGSGGKDGPVSIATDNGKLDSRKEIVPLPPSAAELERAIAGKVAPISGASLNLPADTGMGDGGLHLIGTIGDRALILKPDGQTDVVQMGSEFDVGEKTAKLVAVSARAASVVMDGKRKELKLEAAQSIVAKARAEQDAATAKQSQSSQKTSGGSTPKSVGIASTGVGK